VTLAEWVSAALTGVTALATLVLAGVTWLLWRSTQRMAAATSDPYVVATLEPNRWSIMHMDLVIENAGTGTAFDVQLEFDPPLTRERNDDTNKPPISRIAVLRRSQVLRDYISEGAGLLASSYRVTVSWKASPRAAARTTNSYELDVSHYKGFIPLGGPHPQVQMAQELKKFRDSFEKAFTGLRRLGIDVYTASERREEAEAQQRRWASQSAMDNQRAPSIAERAPAKKARKPRTARKA
jgi:hypothetical protein